jgi:acyl dehydratase
MSDTDKKTQLGVTVGSESAGVRTLRYEDIQVGDKVTPYTKWITFQSAVKFGRTYKDVFSGHINAKVSQGQFGVASMPVQGAVLEAGVTPMMVNWLRSAKPWLYGGRQESKFIQIAKPGDTLVYQGTVKEKLEEGGRKYVVVDFFAENQKGEKVVVGTARAAF